MVQIKVQVTVPVQVMSQVTVQVTAQVTVQVTVPNQDRKQRDTVKWLQVRITPVGPTSALPKCDHADQRACTLARTPDSDTGKAPKHSSMSSSFSQPRPTPGHTAASRQPR